MYHNLNKPTEWWLEGSDFYGSIQDFKLAREPFNRYISSGDRVLDIGCANGFLLYMLLHWREDSFIPHGIDINENRIEIAKQLFSSSPENFSTQNMYSFNWVSQKFDTIITPCVLEESFLGPIATYKANFPDTNLLFSLYDDEVEFFESHSMKVKNRFKNYQSNFIEIPNITKIIFIGKHV